MARRLVVFDLDGTLLRGLTVCEVLAAPVGRAEEMAELERLEELDEIRAARVTMLDWYGNTPVEQLCEWLGKATLAPGAVEGCERLRAAGCALAIASFTWEFAVAHFAHMIGAHHWLGTSVGADGSFDHVWPETKATWLLDLAEHLRIDSGAVAAVGDGMFDLPMLRAAGTSVFVGPSLLDGLPPETLHLPGADLRDVADHLLEQEQG
jgi:phosphoserine phosphatase